MGDLAGLSVMTDTVLDLAAGYAREFGVKLTDHPDIQVLAVCKAYARYRQMQLMIALEREMQARVLEAEGADVDYGKALLDTTRAQTYKSVNQEIERLGQVASRYDGSLRTLAARLSSPSDP